LSGDCTPEIFEWHRPPACSQAFEVLKVGHRLEAYATQSINPRVWKVMAGTEARPTNTEMARGANDKKESHPTSLLYKAST